MAKHAGTVAGWALDTGADRKRKMTGRPTYGKHGNGHVGAVEARVIARLVLVNRAIGRKRSRHGISANHPVAARVIMGSVARRVRTSSGPCDYATITRYRAAVGA